jgi:hypothetical protein
MTVEEAWPEWCLLLDDLHLAEQSYLEANIEWDYAKIEYWRSRAVALRRERQHLASQFPVFALFRQ